ncbi:spermidine synthase [Sphingomonas prati]|uniref:Spermidine synthase n=1 Tax=Sphingomonas prati TaxID=1843237 RepID=A0A7W9BUF0_9SPHN|nr:spermidine synthase [Sphingomonas prati]MBB5730211.1 spermidine synthase [Sphingomonas prati]GGE92415.1 spermidine synthase [Sphingomonas prati]
MLPRTLIDSTEIAGGGTLRLIRRGDEWSITLANNELMNSRTSGSEVALATLGCDPVIRRRAPRVLIGGLGMGFTLRAGLSVLPMDAVVEVAELVPAVITWARGPLAPLHGDGLTDPRTRLFEGDVLVPIRAARGGYDAILLDVDNGPDGLSRAGNDALYDATGLRAAATALRPGGVLAVWSTAPDAGFVRRMATAGFAVTEHIVRANGPRGGARHIVWVGVLG